MPPNPAHDAGETPPSGAAPHYTESLSALRENEDASPSLQGEALSDSPAPPHSVVAPDQDGAAAHEYGVPTDHRSMTEQPGTEDASSAADSEATSDGISPPQECVPAAPPTAEPIFATAAVVEAESPPLEQLLALLSEASSVEAPEVEAFPAKPLTSETPLNPTAPHRGATAVTDGPPSIAGASAAPAWNYPASARRAPAAEHVRFSVLDGSYDPPIHVVLSCPTEGAQVRYTIDGSTPTDASPLYEAPIRLAESGVVSARAWAEAMEPSPVTSTQYEIRLPEWRVLEPEDPTDGVAHEVTEHKVLETGWHCVAASVRGRLHAHRALWREDAFMIAQAKPWTVLAVSDGAGSAPLSRVGSQIVCDQVTTAMKELLATAPPPAVPLSVTHEEMMATVEADVLPTLRAHAATAAARSLEAMRDEAARRQVPVDALACTLLLLVFGPIRNVQVGVALQVGDGAIALVSADHTLALLSQADHGEHSSETRFLTTRGVEADLGTRAQPFVAGSVAAFALMTDGVSDDFFPEQTRLIDLFTASPVKGFAGKDGGPVTGVFHSVTHEIQPEHALGVWLGYEKRGSSDDRTLMLCWKDT